MTAVKKLCCTLPALICDLEFDSHCQMLITAVSVDQLNSIQRYLYSTTAICGFFEQRTQTNPDEQA